LVTGIVDSIKGKIEARKLNKVNREQALEAWEKQNGERESRSSIFSKKYDQDFKQQREEMGRKFARAMQRYEVRYYCYRDNCLFIPSESDHASPRELEEFLYREKVEA